MTGGRWFFAAVLVTAWAWAPGGPAARADIINGDFSDGLNSGWGKVVVPNDDESLTLWEVVDGKLHIRTVNTWTWNAGMQQWLGTGSNYMTISQAVPAEMGFWAPDGTDAIEFYANVTVLNSPAGNLFAGVEFQISYGTATGAGFNTSGMLAGVDQTIRVELPGLVANAQTGINLNLTTWGVVAAPPDPQDGMSYDVTVDAYLDNFRFVPEPASMMLLAAGAVALFARRRRR